LVLIGLACHRYAAVLVYSALLRSALLCSAVLGLAAVGLDAQSASTRTSPSLDIHYVPTPTAVVEAMLTLARVTPQDVVYDLGSGDGRIVLTAARRFGARGVGIELDPALVKRANDEAMRSGLANRVTFSQADLFKTDLSQATVVTLYLSPSINLRLESKLKRELRPGARVVSHRFPIGNWTPDEDIVVGGTHVYFWTVGPR
jgi:SAM-dependent methyltransferase